MTLFWCTFVIVTYALVGRHPNVCSWFQYYPYGYSVVMLPTHLVMILRIYSLYERSAKILIGLLALAIVDFAIQMGVNHLATSVLLRNYNETATCFTYPTTAVFSLVFISPVIFHHILLGLTLWQSAQYLRRSGDSISTNPILHVIRRDHIAYTLAICLINFTNLVLVLQPGAFAYKLIMQLPAVAFTQIFLSKIVFSLKKSAKTSDSSAVQVSPNSSGQTNSSNARRGHKSGGSASTSATAYERDYKTPSSPTSTSFKGAPRSPTKVQFPRTWRLSEDTDNDAPLTRLPLPVSTVSPFGSMPLRNYTFDGQHKRRGSSLDRVEVGRETVSSSEVPAVPDTFLSTTPEPSQRDSTIGLAV